LQSAGKINLPLNGDALNARGTDCDFGGSAASTAALRVRAASSCSAGLPGLCGIVFTSAKHRCRERNQENE
jgi:hypothetical protein